jgi:hypothetical protein
MTRLKQTLCLDFDGVIHSCEQGWQEGEIYGTLLPGFLDWLEEARQYFNIVIYSSRSATDEGRAAMAQWLTKQAGKPLTVEFAAVKPAAFLTIDDRALTFNGDWRDPIYAPDVLRGFQPWNERRKGKG